MASGQDFTRHQQSIIHRYYEHRDTIMLSKLSETVSDLYLCTEPGKRLRLWDSVAKALTQLDVPEARIQQICAIQKVELLAELVTELNKGPGAGKVGGERGATSAAPGQAAPVAQPSSGGVSAVAPASGGVTPETLKSALKAFRKRMKLTRLDEESQIGSRRNPLTTGTRSNIVAIQPPTQFPREVWEELVKQGKLKSAGRGFYQLIEGA